MFFACVFGGMLAIVAELLDQRIYSAEEIQEVMEAPVVATLPTLWMMNK